MNRIIKIICVFILSLLMLTPLEIFALQGAALRSLCDSSYYTCIRVQRGENWDNMFTTVDARDIVMRVNRMNSNLWPGMVIAVPNNLNGVQAMDFSPFPRSIDAPGRKVVIVEPSQLAWGAYNPDGSLVNWGPVSMGKGWCPDIHGRCVTPAGRFAVYEKRGPGCFSTKFPVGKGGAPMPYCMFFKGGYALHASEVPGYHASHGCIRLFYPDAKWLNQQFIDIGTQVIVRPYST